MNPGDGDAMCGTTGSADALQAGFAALGAPLELPEPTIRAMDGADWLLLGPHLHVAWRQRITARDARYSRHQAWLSQNVPSTGPMRGISRAALMNRVAVRLAG